MAEIREGLEDNVDVSIYAKPEFNWVQMHQIKLGLKQNIDVSIYAKSKINSGKMARIRHFNSFKKCRRM